jgi:drug/metabolite transporter (DMT)-like permease
MPAELLAFLAAVFFAGSAISTKFAASHGSMVGGLVISLVTGTLSAGIFAAFTVDDWAVEPHAVALFAAGGLVGPGAARLLQMRAVRDLGASVAVPVSSSTTPLLASIAGVVIFGESMTFDRVLALALIIIGIWACTSGGSANRVVAAPGPEVGPVRRRIVSALWIPVGAGAGYAVADMFRKGGVDAGTEPLVGALIGIAAATVIWALLFSAVPALREPIRLNPSLGWFCLSGVLAGAAQILSLFAIRDADLSVVAPIVASQPVVVVIVSALVLRNLETMRLGTVIGAVTVFLGVSFLSFA